MKKALRWTFRVTVSLFIAVFCVLVVSRVRKHFPRSLGVEALPVFIGSKDDSQEYVLYPLEKETNSDPSCSQDNDYFICTAWKLGFKTRHEPLINLTSVGEDFPPILLFTSGSLTVLFAKLEFSKEMAQFVFLKRVSAQVQHRPGSVFAVLQGNFSPLNKAIGQFQHLAYTRAIEPVWNPFTRYVTDDPYYLFGRGVVLTPTQSSEQ